MTSSLSLLHAQFVPDFVAYVGTPSLRYIKISRQNLAKALSGEWVFHTPLISKGAFAVSIV
jgi:hypothetical protein